MEEEMKHYIVEWREWEELCFEHGLNPLGQIEFGIDEGGGNSTDFEYIGDMPEKENEKS